MKNYDNLGYGVFLQDGGQAQMQDPNGAQMIEGNSQDQATDQAQAQGAPGEANDPQTLAEQFLKAFQQLPPEAQQMVMQALSQGGQQGQRQ